MDTNVNHYRSCGRSRRRDVSSQDVQFRKYKQVYEIAQ